jgi:hypothetical protein
MNVEMNVWVENDSGNVVAGTVRRRRGAVVDGYVVQGQRCPTQPLIIDCGVSKKANVGTVTQYPILGTMYNITDNVCLLPSLGRSVSLRTSNQFIQQQCHFLFCLSLLYSE